MNEYKKSFKALSKSYNRMPFIRLSGSNLRWILCLSGFNDKESKGITLQELLIIYYLLKYQGVESFCFQMLLERKNGIPFNNLMQSHYFL